MFPGVIYRPLTSNEIFKTRHDFIETFDFIDNAEHNGSILTFQDIIIPRHFFDKEKILKNSIYRINLSLFNYCHRYSRGDISYKDLFDFSESNQQKIEFSSIETKSYDDWSKETYYNMKQSKKFIRSKNEY